MKRENDQCLVRSTLRESGPLNDKRTLRRRCEQQHYDHQRCVRVTSLIIVAPQPAPWVAVIESVVIDFKNNYGPDRTGALGAAGHFAYGAIASGVGYSQSFAEFGAGAYAVATGKPNPVNPMYEDDSAAQNIPAGYSTIGCTRPQ